MSQRIFMQEKERYEHFVRHIDYLKNRYPDSNEEDVFTELLKAHADMSENEYSVKYRMGAKLCNENCPVLTPMHLRYTNVPYSIDWRKKVKTILKKDSICFSI